MKIITWLCHKGGVGKTTLSYNTAAGLAARGYRVALVDADPQGSLTHMAGFQREPAFYDLIERDAAFGSCFRQIDPDVYCPEKDGGYLLLMPGNAETDNINVQRHAKRLRDKLRALVNDVDVVIIDTNPSPSKLHVGAYLATDYIIYPCIPEELPLVGLEDSISFTIGADELRVELGYHEIKIAGIVPTMVKQTTVQHAHFIGEMCNRYGAEYVWPQINHLTAWSEAAHHHRPVYVYEPGGKAAEQLHQVMQRVEAIISYD